MENVFRENHVTRGHIPVSFLEEQVVEWSLERFSFSFNVESVRIGVLMYKVSRKASEINLLSFQNREIK